MVKDFDVIKSTMTFKINIVKLIDEYPKLKNLLLLQCFMKDYFKLIKEICKENTGDFK